MKRVRWLMDFWRKTRIVLGKNGRPQRVTYMCAEVYDGFARPWILGLER